MERTNNPATEEEIYEENKNLIHGVLKTFFKGDTKYLSYEDLFQEGSIGLLKAIRTFDGDKGTAFGSYATICIRNEIRAYIIRNKFKGVKVGRYVQYDAIKGGEEAVDDLVDRCSVQLSGAPNFPEGWLNDNCSFPSAEDEAIVNIRTDEVIAAIESEKQRAIIRRFLQTQNAIKTAEEFGVSKAAVFRAVKKFREMYLNDG